eukprot:3624704-Pyramimonas_sp.AAC.1
MFGAIDVRGRVAVRGGRCSGRLLFGAVDVRGEVDVTALTLTLEGRSPRGRRDERRQHLLARCQLAGRVVPDSQKDLHRDVWGAVARHALLGGQPAV